MKMNRVVPQTKRGNISLVKDNIINTTDDNSLINQTVSYPTINEFNVHQEHQLN